MDFFAPLPEAERRDALLSFAEEAVNHGPRKAEAYAIAEERQDEGCLDSVGIFLHLDADQRVTLRVRLGSEVQTLTRALGTILCRGLQHATPSDIRKLPDDFIPVIVGAPLMRLRSRTVYYMLHRIREAAHQLE